MYRVSHGIGIFQIQKPDHRGRLRLRIGVVGSAEQNRGDDSPDRADQWSQTHDGTWSVHSLALGERLSWDRQQPGSTKQDAD